MTLIPPLPRAAEPFVAFAAALRANGFPVAPEQTQDFIAAVGLLGPGSMTDIYRAGLALLAPPPERRDEFDALFRLVFLGQSIAGRAAEGEEEDVTAYDERDGGEEPPEADETTESGGEATAAETLSVRRFAQSSEISSLLRLRRKAPDALPRRRSRRLGRAKSGGRPDLRRTLREAARRDGEMIDLPMRARRTRQRRVLLLIDVSGSMKEHTEGALRFAHALRHSARQLEAFTLGTRLTRITRALRHRNREQALFAVSHQVADWDGGTRLGEALASFLAVPRFAGFARGALVVVLSDGLERGDPATLIAATERLSRLAWHILWLTPLAGEGHFVPQTEALMAIAPHVSRFGSARSVASLCDEMLEFAGRAA